MYSGYYEASGCASYETISASWKYELLSALPSCILLQLCVVPLFHLDAKSAARGGMLHDLFLYDWHTHAKETGQRFHGLTHPKTALNHACRLFSLNDIEKDVIRAHMWPVTFFSIPHTKEGWIITLTDKYCGAFESMKRK